MSKIGRNEPCPCGSGKKYKKCCYGKKQIQKFAENDEIAFYFEDDIEEDNLIRDWDEENDFSDSYEDDYDPDDESDYEEDNSSESEQDDDKDEPFVIKTISDDCPEISDEEEKLIDDWYESYCRMKTGAQCKKHLEDFMQNHPKLVVNLEVHEEAIYELVDKLIREGHLEECIDFIIQFRKEFPDSYIKCYDFLDLKIISYKIAIGQIEQISEYLNYFKEYPDHDADSYFELLTLLRSTGCTESLFDLLNETYRSICHSRKVLNGHRVLGQLDLQYKIPILEAGVYDEKDVNSLVEKIKSIPVELNDWCYVPDEHKKLLDDYLQAPENWSEKSFKNCTELFPIYSQIRRNFTTYLKREQGFDWVTADYYAETVEDYLFDVIPDGMKPKTVFVFTKKLIDKTLSRRCFNVLIRNLTRFCSSLRAMYWFAEYLEATQSIETNQKVDIQQWCSEIHEIVADEIRYTESGKIFATFPK